MTAGMFWLLEWMETSGIRQERDIEKAISDYGKFKELNDLAMRASMHAGDESRTNNPVVAGRGIDLSGELTGADDRELINEVDQVFGATWHYFDEIIVEGLSARRYSKMISNGDHVLARERARAHCFLLLHLRKIGALDSVVFRQKLDPCIRHGNDSSKLEAAGLKRILDDRESIVKTLMEGSLHDIEDHYAYGGHYHYVYEHPLVGIRSGHLEGSPAGRSEHELKKLICEEIFNLFAEFTAVDVAVASDFEAPLAVFSPMIDFILALDNREDEAASEGLPGEVAIEIGMPILCGVSAADLLKIREDEADAFERFRSALRAAINETVKQRGKRDVNAVAVTVLNDFLVPALHDIDQRLNVARKILSRKSAANLTVGSAAVTVGIIAGIPLLLPAGIALGMMAPGVNLGKYLEEKGEVELSDMYFLWKLQRKLKVL
ncbi:hypothetical protein [Amycolatopsis sp. NPDC049868]|uniref:hypothetical protein n=1 Tax=Amycolatopsis sp. NPDC049868 TaxID=3363934 RepID=UPI0037B74CDD